MPQNDLILISSKDAEKVWKENGYVIASATRNMIEYPGGFYEKSARHESPGLDFRLWTSRVRDSLDAARLFYFTPNPANDTHRMEPPTLGADLAEHYDSLRVRILALAGSPQALQPRTVAMLHRLAGKAEILDRKVDFDLVAELPGRLKVWRSREFHRAVVIETASA